MSNPYVSTKPIKVKLFGSIRGKTVSEFKILPKLNESSDTSLIKVGVYAKYSENVYTSTFIFTTYDDLKEIYRHPKNFIRNLINDGLFR